MKRYRAFQKKFHEWKRTKPGFILWTIIRPLIGLAGITAYIFLPAPFKWYTYLLWVVCCLPDWVPGFVHMGRILSKYSGFGRLKPGDIVSATYDKGEQRRLTLMSADLSNQAEFDEKLLEAMREAVKVNPASIGNVLIVNFDKYRKVTESGDLLFVLEEEELSKNPFWIEWDPYKPKGSRVKVLFKNGIYWANPKFLRKVKKAEDE